MLTRILIVWIVYAGVMGFAVGGSFVAAYQIPLSQHETSADTEQGTSNQNAKEKPEDALARYTLWLTIFTGVMAFATVGLGIATVGLYATGEKQIGAAIKAANAADLSARAAIALETPLIKVSPASFGYGVAQDSDGKQIENFAFDSFWVSNRGRTKAFPIEIKWGWTVGDSLPEVPRYTLRKRFDLNSSINENDGNISIFIREFTMELSPGDTEKITSRMPDAPRLWFYCSLAYDDFMGTQHEIGFCWRRYETLGGGSFVADTTPAYNRRT